MRVCVVGAGAIGGLVATKLHLAGERVSVIDKGRNSCRDQKQRAAPRVA